jgi:hypothetical protein
VASAAGAEAFNGGVYFLRVPPCPSSTDQDARKEAAREAAAELQVALLQQLGHADKGTKDAGCDRLHTALQHLFATELCSRSHLLVLDDAWDYKIIQYLRCTSMAGAILITARERVVRDDAEGPIMWLQPDNASRASAAELMDQLLADNATGKLSPNQQVSRGSTRSWGLHILHI